VTFPRPSPDVDFDKPPVCSREWSVRGFRAIKRGK